MANPFGLPGAFDGKSTIPDYMSGVSAPITNPLDTSIQTSPITTPSNPLDAVSKVDGNTLPKTNYDGGNDRLSVVLPRSAAPHISNGTLSWSSSDMDKRGSVAAIRLLVNPDITNRQTNVNGIDFTTELGFLTSTEIAFQNFLLTGFSTTLSEKVQVQTTFGDNEVVYYFGREPVMMNLQGLLIDSIESDWFTKFIAIYQTTIRGSMLAKHYELIELVLPNMRLVCSIMSLGFSQESSRDTDIPFTMQILVKELIPLPVPMGADMIRKLASQGTSKMLSFKEIYKTSPADTVAGLISGKTSSKADMGANIGLGGFNIVNGQLTGFASSVFSPVYGVLSDLTKIVQTTGGDIASLLNQFTKPVNTILADITSISTQAVALSNAVDQAVNGVVAVPNQLIGNLNFTLASVKNASGIISRTPETVAQAMARLNRTASLSSNAAILGGGNKASAASKLPLLNSGSAYNPTVGYKL